MHHLSIIIYSAIEIILSPSESCTFFRNLLASPNSFLQSQSTATKCVNKTHKSGDTIYFTSSSEIWPLPSESIRLKQAFLIWKYNSDDVKSSPKLSQGLFELGGGQQGANCFYILFLDIHVGIRVFGHLCLVYVGQVLPDERDEEAPPVFHVLGVHLVSHHFLVHSNCLFT